ncbi:hypothetical protein AWB69_01671 [Caballeronia udeis]|uniref:Uncharacterized protein n=2 Tax=Caballeronia udeis TaxID=1232866 RepID=A0A158FWQ8_9BURK|nr:hypothetical protein AWB69_01671 [Caballeronia udeis]
MVAYERLSRTSRKHGFVLARAILILVSVDQGTNGDIMKTPLYLAFFGYPELARSVRSDDGYLLDLITPDALRRRSNASARPQTTDIPA